MGGLCPGDSVRKVFVLHSSMSTHPDYVLYLMTSLNVSEKPCLVPERIPHANTSKTGVVLFDEEVTVTCNTGYGVNGSSEKIQNIKCEASQTFKKTMPCQSKFTLILINLNKQC